MAGPTQVSDFWAGEKEEWPQVRAPSSSHPPPSPNPPSPPSSVVLDTNPAAPAAQRFKMTYDVDTPPIGGRHMLVATSPDGLRWTPQVNVPNLPASFGDTMTCLMFERSTQSYIAFGRHDLGAVGPPCPGNYGTFRRVARANASAVSSAPAGIGNFSAPTDALMWDSEDPACFDLYNAAALQVGPHILAFPAGTLHLVNSTNNPYTLDYGKNDNLLEVRLAHSANVGLSFNYTSRGELILCERKWGGGQMGTIPSIHRHCARTLSSLHPAAPFLPRGIGMRDAVSGMFNTSGSDWDSGFVFMATGMVPVGENYVDFFYFGSQMTHHYAAYYGNANVNVPKGYGRARLRREGFVSLAPVQFTMSGAGWARTHALQPAQRCAAGQQTQIMVNVDISVAGNMTVQLLDPNTMVVVPGYGGRANVPIVAANAVRLPLRVGCEKGRGVSAVLCAC